MEKKLKFFLSSFFIVLSLIGFAQEESDTFESLNASEFYIKMETNPASVVLDVRLFSKYQEERIPGALLAEKKEKLIALTDTINRRAPILVYCDDGERSRTVCEILTKEQGFQDVYNLENGLDAWKNRKLPLDKESLNKKEIR